MNLYSLKININSILYDVKYYSIILLLQDGSYVLVAAARGGHCDIVKLLLSEGADSNAENWVSMYLHDIHVQVVMTIYCMHMINV